MAKNTTKKIKELKGIKPEKITDEQLKELQVLVKDINMIHHQIGVLEAKKHNMLHGIANGQDQLTVIQTELEKEYGTTDINIVDGTINYPKENGEANKKN